MRRILPVRKRWRDRGVILTMNGRSRRAAIIITVAAAMSAAFTYAQGLGGDLAGTVLDPSGAAIAGAQIKAANTATGVESSIQSGPTGAYRLADLPAGDYSLNVTAPSFAPSSVKGVVVSGSRTLTIYVTLQVGSVSSRVDVQAEAEIGTTS